MSSIAILPADLVNKIAAGEVIERPASVVKELVENALDAGATRVSVEIEEGGRKLIRVTDDGSGMAPDDLPLAFAPHATSKLRSMDDLFRVATFGFRGEALASIGAVAKVTLTSRKRGATGGAELVMNAGKAGRVKPASNPEGTIVDVRDLFHAVPVRRKFLRSPEVELEHVEEGVVREALAHPGVRFELTADGERRRLLPSAKDVRERIALCFGKELADALVEIEAKSAHASFTAFAAPPKYARLSLKWQYLYLNGRFIRDRVLTRAINEAYHEVLPHGRYPVVFLFLAVPPEEVDVNVHPTKIEVRFKSVWKLHDLILGALRQKMLASELAPSIDPGILDRPKAGPPAPAPMVQEIVDFFAGGAPAATETATIPAAPADRALVTTGRRVFQLHDRYLIEEVEEGIRIIDQHALHERYMLGRLREQYKATDVPKQRLLVPALMDVTAAERARLDEHKDLLESTGFDLGEFGPKGVAVRAVPALVADADPESLVRDFLEMVEAQAGSEKKLGHALPMIDRTLEFLACRSAIKFGKRLSAEEIERLLADAGAMDFSATCAHGRPTAVRLTLEDLEKFFKRRGS